MNILRDGRKPVKTEGQIPSEQQAGNEGGCHSRCHGRQQHYGRKVSVQFFQGKDYTGQRRVKSGSQTGAGTAGDQVALFHAGASQHAADSLGRYRAKLDRRTFPAKGKACAQPDDAPCQFDP